ncbi:DEAD/DEAH box helicase [Hamadaea tsunoensis]|uniref:DEAD/DEAH box helicase n=1 Tax=Hamadaea tsunoensis TaxID=53368 RepID=UPI0003FDBF41|nr:DEAD/DEAH box helicase [Hamadaea tsunoensis]
MPFKGGAKARVVAANPEAHYRDLPRRPGAVSGLWAHQGDLLRTYAGSHLDDSDLALELPTGTGKTLPGLVIADWVRRNRSGRVAYTCPTKQLAQQVAKVAAREGVPVVLLSGKHASWSTQNKADYEGAAAVAITTYSTIFNSSPKLAIPDLLLFDDAHAGEQYVGEQYAIRISRYDNEALYLSVLEVLAPAIDGMPLQRLRDTVPDPGIYRTARLVVPLNHTGMVGRLDGVLSQLAAPWSFRYSMIRGVLQACLVYVSYGSILIRPVIPPTADNIVFSGARQRIYLSATLGSGGELERAFGRAPIRRLPLPATTPTPRSGRRFFVFPDVVTDVDPMEVATAIVKEAGKALVLAPDRNTAVATAAELAQPGWPVLTIDELGDGMEPFVAADHATCGLAARYDGLDLPGDSCRVVVLHGKPDADNLQERFLSENVRAGTALAERLRTRVVQGAGRCTRGPNDWAVVVILGSDLTTYLFRPETRQSLDPELQAEISFGIENSRDATAEDMLANVRTFLAQADEWRDDAEPRLTEERNAATVTLPAGTDALTKSVPDEIAACALAGAGQWREASARAAAAALTLGGAEELRGYRSFWLYLAGVWADQAGVNGNDPAQRQHARALIANAEAAAKPATWIRDLPPLPDMPRPPLTSAAAAAVATVAARLSATTAPKAEAAVTKMLAGLQQRTPSQYEPELTQLGHLLGAAAGKPAGSGRCDSTWCWNNDLWMALDAKSDHEPKGMVPLKDVRQANDQLRMLAADRNTTVIPPDSIAVILSPKPAVDPDAVISAEAHVYLAHPDVVHELAATAGRAWHDLLADRAGRTEQQLRDLVADRFSQDGLLPEQVRDRLSASAVRTASP